MYADRTPTNRELLAEVMGYVAVIAGAVMLSFAAAFVFWSSMSFAWLQLTPVSTALLMVGWEVQITPPRQSFHYPPVLTMVVVCILCAVIGGAYGLYLIGFIGLTSAIFVVPVSTITTFGSWRTWRNSEGSTRGKRSLEPVVLNSGGIIVKSSEPLKKCSTMLASTMQCPTSGQPSVPLWNGISIGKVLRPKR